MADTVWGWRLTRGRAWLLVALAWAALYLPALGSLEVQGNEAKRILPALHMLAGGSWITPQLAGVKYFNKPPLMYWMIAGSFVLTGSRGEWAARLPSVVAVLVFVSLLVLRGRAWLGVKGRMCAALIFMTVVSFIEKGRQSEIDAAFVCVTGCALWWWLSAWGAVRGACCGECARARWRLWLPAAVIIGIGLLLKGPLLLVFVYVPLICVLAFERRLRELFTWPHGVAVLVWAGMLLAWVIACTLENPHNAAQTVWREEMGSRFLPEDFSVVAWLGSVLKVPVDFLPWFVFVPLLWWPSWTRSIAADEQRVFKAVRLALLICFVLVNSLPGTRPRYSMPLFAGASILLGWLLAAQAAQPWLQTWWVRALRVASVAWMIAAGGALLLGPTGIMSRLLRTVRAPVQVPPLAGSVQWLYMVGVTAMIIAGAWWLGRHAARRVQNLGDCVCATAGLMAAGMLAFAVYVMPFFTCNAIRRPVGAAIAAVVPEHAALHIFAKPELRESGYQSFLYYVPRTHVYLTNFADAAAAPFVLMAAHHTNDWLAANAARHLPMSLRTNVVYKQDVFCVLGRGAR